MTRLLIAYLNVEWVNASLKGKGDWNQKGWLGWPLKGGGNQLPVIIFEESVMLPFSKKGGENAIKVRNYSK